MILKSEPQGPVTTLASDLSSGAETASPAAAGVIDPHQSRTPGVDSFLLVHLEQARFRSRPALARPSAAEPGKQAPVPRSTGGMSLWYTPRKIASQPSHIPAAIPLPRPIPLVRPGHEAAALASAALASTLSPVKAARPAPSSLAVSRDAAPPPAQSPVKAPRPSPAPASPAVSQDAAPGPALKAPVSAGRSDKAPGASPRNAEPWDSLFSLGSAVAGVAAGLIRPIAGQLADWKLDDRMLMSALSARSEWESGVREIEKNRSPQIDEYVRNAGFKPESGKAWCGAFVAFNYAQNGFKHSPSLASMQKARDFFLYRNYIKDTSDPATTELDVLRAEHAATGSARHYFMLEESPDIRRIRGNSGRYGHVDLASSVFSYETLPIEPGDTVVFCKTAESNGHVGMVLTYDRARGILVTLEGNTDGEASGGGRVRQGVARKVYDLKDPEVRKQFGGFGRPSAGDFE